MLKERTLLIIKSILNSNNRITFEILAEEFQISERTIRNEIKIANDFLSKNKSAYIKNLKKTGLVLEFRNYTKEELTKFIEKNSDSLFLQPKERIFDLILDVCFSKLPIYLHHKQIQYQISKSTLDEDMRRIRSQLSYYHIEIVSIPKQGLTLFGLERNIHTMLFDLINNNVPILNHQTLHSDESSSFEKILFSKISKDIFKKIDLLYDNSISAKQDNYYRNYFLIFTGIWICRIKKNKNSILVNNNNYQFSKSEINSFIKAVIVEFNIPASKQEIKYLKFILKTLSPKNINNSLEWIQAQLLTIQLIQFVEKETNIPFSNREEDLYEGLNSHILGLLDRIKNGLQVTNPLKDIVKKNHKQIYQSIKKFSPVIEQITKDKISSDEITFLTIYFSTSESKINQNITQIYKAVVVCNHGSATGKLLAENLKEKFNIEIVATLSSRELDILNRLDADLIFSTIKLNNINKPVCVLQPIIGNLEQNKIELFLDQNCHFKRQVQIQNNYTKLLINLLDILENNYGKVDKEIHQEFLQTLDNYKLKINKREIQPMLKEILKESDILFDLSAKDWTESIQKTSQPLVESKIIEPRYVEAMINTIKKYGPYIVIDKHIALAHARPEDGVNKLGISVAKLKTPVSFGSIDNDPVKVIFCLAAVNSYSHLNIMKNLVELINDKERLTRLFSASNKLEFQTELYS